MSKELKITLSDEWYNWVEGEATHRGQSESELFEDALAAFLAELQANVKRIEDEAFHQKGFCGALESVFTSNARIRRRLWSRSVFVGLENAILCIKGFSHSGPDDGKWHPWTITESDYFADDWEIVE